MSAREEQMSGQALGLRRAVRQVGEDTVDMTAAAEDGDGSRHEEEEEDSRWCEGSVVIGREERTMTKRRDAGAWSREVQAP